MSLRSRKTIFRLISELNQNFLIMMQYQKIWHFLMDTRIHKKMYRAYGKSGCEDVINACFITLWWYKTAWRVKAIGWILYSHCVCYQSDPLIVIIVKKKSNEQTLNLIYFVENGVYLINMGTYYAILIVLLSKIKNMWNEKY